MSYTTAPQFTVDEVGFIQSADLKVLLAVARGEIDLNKLALEEIANRGLNHHGTWVTFKAARAIFQASIAKLAGKKAA